jgi:hypothetical protein
VDAGPGPADWVQVSPQAGPAARYYHMMSYDSAHQVTVLFGGQSGSGLMADTWEWNGTTWTHSLPAASPSARRAATMAFDSHRGVSVLFGGEGAGGATLGDTWEWSGTNWTQRFPSTSPPARADAFMTFDSVRGVTVLFGGTANGGFFDDTWIYDGTNWTEESPMLSPPATAGGTYMTFDPQHEVAVMFGGCAAGGVCPTSATWEWTGTDWQSTAPSERPSARFYASISFNAGQSASILFGGCSGNAVVDQCDASRTFGDTWAWNGASWSELLPAHNPPVRYRTAMVYDSNRQVNVLFGGWNTTSTWLGDTWELGSR